jgi:hypothetical protein
MVSVRANVSNERCKVKAGVAVSLSEIRRIRSIICRIRYVVAKVANVEVDDDDVSEPSCKCANKQMQESKLVSHSLR